MDTYLIKEMIKDELKKEGYNYLDDIRFSLSHCQGDGIAFYGGVTKNITDDMIKELPYIEQIIKYVNNYLDINLEEIGVHYEVKKDMRFHLYDHYNTMIVTNAGYADMHHLLCEIFSDIESKHNGNNIYELVNNFTNDKEITEEVIEYMGGDGYYWESEFVNYFIDVIKDNNTEELVQEELRKLSKRLEKKAYDILDRKEVIVT